MKHLRELIIILIISVIVTVIAGSLYSWYLLQTIHQVTYSSKAGVDFWTTWTLENNVFSAALLLTILSMITLPQRSSFLSFVSALAQPQRYTKRLPPRSAFLWRIIEFALLFIFYVYTGGYSITGQNVAFLMMLLSHGSISITPDQVSTLFALPFSPGTSTDSVISLIPAMEAYQLYIGLISTFIVATAIRFILSIATEMMSRRRDMYIVISAGLFVVALFLFLEFLSVPMWTVNAGTWLTFVTIILAFVSALIGSGIFLVMRIMSGDAQQRLRSKIVQLEESLARLQGELLSLRHEYESGGISAEEYRQKVALLMEDRSNIGSELRRLKLERMLPIWGDPKRFAFAAIILVVLCFTAPVIQAVHYGIQMEGDKYIDWKFSYETRKEIEITNWAAGLSEMEQLSLEDLTSNATPEGEVEFLTTVRQWDQTASYLRMKNQIGTNWMQLADSDIVYIKGHEYWIAPLTFDYATITTSFINQHIYYTHTEGLVVLDAFSGDIIQDDVLISLLNRTESISTYYGEGAGFDDVVFVNMEEFDEIGTTNFQGSADYTLSGLESIFYLFNMGPDAWSFMGQDMSLLIERNVVSRVRKVMLQGITVDRDPYIVVDPSGSLYYAVSVYIDYRLATAYAHENYLRFLGQVLVDIESGELTFYRSDQEDSGFFIDRTYEDYYPWQEVPDWLQAQMKWPEDLYERQLDIAYIYHVDDGLKWKSGEDFHESPEGSDTRYILMRIGGIDRFVAMHNAEFYQSEGRNLAGIYVMGCGDSKFGQLTFYSAEEEDGVSTLLGPSAAVQAFETNDNVRTQLQLWGKHRFGNRLLYHLGGDLFFVVPVFLEVSSSSNIVIEKLGGVGLVDAKSGERVQLGSNVIEAYYKMFGLLNQTTVSEGEVGFESAVFTPVTVDTGEFTRLVTLMRNNDNISHNLQLDIVIASGNFTVVWHGSEVSPIYHESNTTFSLDIGELGPGDLYGTSPTLAVNLPSGVVLAQYLVEVVLRTEEGIVDSINLFLTVTQST
jgi:hypothetical protein